VPRLVRHGWIGVQGTPGQATVEHQRQRPCQAGGVAGAGVGREALHPLAHLLLPVWLRLMGALGTPHFHFNVVR